MDVTLGGYKYYLERIYMYIYMGAEERYVALNCNWTMFFFLATWSMQLEHMMLVDWIWRRNYVPKLNFVVALMPCRSLSVYVGGPGVSQWGGLATGLARVGLNRSIRIRREVETELTLKWPWKFLVREFSVITVTFVVSTFH